MLKQILLGFLNYGPQTGYELKTTIDNSTAHFWHAYHSQIYTTLRKMEKDELVTSEIDETDDKLNRRIYTITDAGRDELEKWLRTSLTDVPPIKNELLVRLFFSGVRDPKEVLNELRIQRSLHQQTLDHYAGIEVNLNNKKHHEDHYNGEGHPNISREVDFWMMTLKHGQAYSQMVIDWLDEIIADLEAV